jgi:hypothetical protein
MLHNQRVYIKEILFIILLLITIMNLFAEIGLNFQQSKNESQTILKHALNSDLIATKNNFKCKTF